MSREAHVRICERLGYVRPRSTRLMISIPPKYAVSQVVGCIKGKGALHIARTCPERMKNSVGQHFRARGYFASTLGRDEQVVRDYIRHQQAEDPGINQLPLT